MSCYVELLNNWLFTKQLFGLNLRAKFYLKLSKSNCGNLVSQIRLIDFEIKILIRIF